MLHRHDSGLDDVYAFMKLFLGDDKRRSKANLVSMRRLGEEPVVT